MRDEENQIKKKIRGGEQRVIDIRKAAKNVSFSK